MMNIIQNRCGKHSFAYRFFDDMFSHRHIEKVCEPNIPDKEPDDKLIHETVMLYAPDGGEDITFD